MKITVKNSSADLLDFLKSTKARNRVFRRADSVIRPPGQVNRLAQSLHPKTQAMKIESIRQEDGQCKTYRLIMEKPGERPAYFRAGQYISVALKLGESTITRPFSLSSTPAESLNPGYYEITVKKTDPGFASAHIFHNWEAGMSVNFSGPEGQFYYQGLRDQKNLICFGGGSGITPFKSMIPQLLEDQTCRVFLFHGALDSSQLLFRSYFEELVRTYPQTFTYVPVLSEPGEQWQGEKGFITRELMDQRIQAAHGEISTAHCSAFICGPPAMERFLSGELKDLPVKNIRREQFANNCLFGGRDIEVYTLTVAMDGQKHSVAARSDESLLVAMERAGLNPPAVCRSGSCGWCRSRLVKGKVESSSENSGLRQADKRFGYIHPCGEFPLGDLEIEVPVSLVNQ